MPVKRVDRLLIRQLLSVSRRFDAQPALKVSLLACPEASIGTIIHWRTTSNNFSATPQGLLYVHPTATKNVKLLGELLPGDRHMYWPLPESFANIVKGRIRALSSAAGGGGAMVNLELGFQALKLLNDRIAFAKTLGMVSPLENLRSTLFHRRENAAASSPPTSPGGPLFRNTAALAPSVLLVSHPMHARDSRHRKVVMLLEHDARDNPQQGSLGVALNAEVLEGYLHPDWFASTRESAPNRNKQPTSKGIIAATPPHAAAASPAAVNVPTRGGAYHSPKEPPAWQLGPGASVALNSVPTADIQVPSNAHAHGDPLEPPLRPPAVSRGAIFRGLFWIRVRTVFDTW
jgi:hypothetical protein